MGAPATTGADREHAAPLDRRPVAFGRGREVLISLSVSIASIAFLLAVLALIA